MPPPGNQVLLLTVQVGGLSGQELSERPDLQPLRTRVGLSPRNLCSQRGEEGYTLAPRGPVGLWFRPGFSSICFVKKARNGEVFGLDSGWIFLLCGEPFSLGAASFAKDSEGKEGRKLATVPFEKAPEEFFVPALGAWAFVWLHSRGSQSCAVPCAVPLDCALL